MSKKRRYPPKPITQCRVRPTPEKVASKEAAGWTLREQQVVFFNVKTGRGH